jgi:hypothetical protein
MAVVLDVGKIEGQTFNSRCSSFCFVHPAQALLNPTPQLLTRDRHAPSRRARAPVPGICGWTRHAEAAVGAGDNVFLADDFSECDEWVFEAKKRFGLSVLDYMVTCNHVHLLIKDTGPNVIARSMQLIAGRTGQEYNQDAAAGVLGGPLSCHRY